MHTNFGLLTHWNDSNLFQGFFLPMRRLEYGGIWICNYMDIQVYVCLCILVNVYIHVCIHMTSDDICHACVNPNLGMIQYIHISHTYIYSIYIIYTYTSQHHTYIYIHLQYIYTLKGISIFIKHPPRPHPSHPSPPSPEIHSPPN